MNTCNFAQNIVVSDVNCNLLTSTDWFNGNTGACRLRVKNFNPADWVAGACAACPNAGGTTWDGTFPLFVPNGLSPFYQIDPATGNIGGKAPLFGNNCACGFLNGFGWYVALACNPQFIWSSNFVVFPNGPVATYTGPFAPSCTAIVSIQIEAYIP
jgi:hypothetical protein